MCSVSSVLVSGSGSEWLTAQYSPVLVCLQPAVSSPEAALVTVMMTRTWRQGTWTKWTMRPGEMIGTML